MGTICPEFRGQQPVPFQCGDHPQRCSWSPSSLPNSRTPQINPPKFQAPQAQATAPGADPGPGPDGAPAACASKQAGARAPSAARAPAPPPAHPEAPVAVPAHQQSVQSQCASKGLAGGVQPMRVHSLVQRSQPVVGPRWLVLQRSAVGSLRLVRRGARSVLSAQRTRGQWAAGSLTEGSH